VYVAQDDVVTRGLVERYMTEVFSKRDAKDRLLFYYSGHGADNKGRTGYMQFANAEPGRFWDDNVLAINRVEDWSRELKLQHILFIIDSCASGLAFTSKAGAEDGNKLLLQALSGNGSRTVLTAGTADEATYALENRQQNSYSVFTKALLVGFASRATQNENGFITITDLFGDAEKQMAKFRGTQNKPTTPHKWTLQDDDYRGTFVFLNSNAKTPLTAEQATALGVLKAKGAEGEASGSGIIEVSGSAGGALFVDGQRKFFLPQRETRQLLQQTPGVHVVELRGQAIETKQVTVESGSIAYATFGVRSPIDESGQAPVGILVLRSSDGLEGDVSIDGYPVGHLDRDRLIRVEHLLVGLRRYSIVGTGITVTGDVQISANQTLDFSVTPAPPTGLTVTVR
jgi:hypothetical protein